MIVRSRLDIYSDQMHALKGALKIGQPRSASSRAPLSSDSAARAREEIMPVRENQPKEEQAAKSAREECVVCQCLDQKVSMAVCNKGHAV